MPLKLLCTAHLTVPLPQPRGWQLVTLSCLVPGSSNTSLLHPTGNIPQPRAVPLSHGSRRKAVPGSQTGTSQLGTDAPFCSSCAPDVPPGWCSGLEGQLTTTSCKPCPAGPMLCLTCHPGACQTQQLPTILGSSPDYSLAAAPLVGSRAPDRCSSEGDSCCGTGWPLQAPSTSTA